MTGTVVVFLKGYPRLSETFIAQEILNLQKAGLSLELVSLRHPTDTKKHPVHHEITAPVNYLPEYIHQEIGRSLRAWWQVRKLPGYTKARNIWLRDLKRDFTRNRVRRFFQACVAACEIGKEARWLYGHFIHTPGSVTRYAAIMRDLPFSISAHAKDIWTSPDWELSEKLNDAEWTVTCTKGGADHLQSLASDNHAVRLVYHGLDLERFPEFARKEGPDGTAAENPVQLLSVGRAVEKKGLDTLLKALSTLPDELNWKWTHIAGGPLLGELKKLTEELSLTEKVEFLGSQSQARVLQAYQESELFILPCRIAADGDRDGLPNVFMEAQSQALPVISTPISGIPELIEDGINGRLVEPDNTTALTEAIVDLARNPALRLKMGKAGEKKVHQDFNAENEIDLLLKLLESKDA